MDNSTKVFAIWIFILMLFAHHTYSLGEAKKAQPGEGTGVKESGKTTIESQTPDPRKELPSVPNPEAVGKQSGSESTQEATKSQTGGSKNKQKEKPEKENARQHQAKTTQKTAKKSNKDKKENTSTVKREPNKSESSTNVQVGENKKKHASIQKMPNILIFIADDLGIGDIGCFGNDTIKTPHIDSLCARGAKLTHHLTADAVCTPSRAALLTGRLPKRIGFSSDTDYINVILFLASSGGLPPNETTFAKVLQQKGYNTGLVGKWHLGLNCKTYGDFCHHPNNHGFDYFFGTPISNARNLGPDGENIAWNLRPNVWPMIVGTSLAGLLSMVFLRRFIGKWPALLLGLAALCFSGWTYFFITHIPMWISAFYRNTELVEQPIIFDNVTERLVAEGVQFLEHAQTQEKPFLLIMSWLQVHSWLHAHRTLAFQGKSEHGLYGDEVEEMDWSVGEMVNTLDRLGFSQDTLIYFTSDNGGHLEDVDYLGRMTGGHNGIYRGGKVQGGQDGGIRMPSTITWPGHIPAGHVVNEPTSQMDIFPTLLSLVGAQVPQDRIYDGVDISDLLLGKKTGQQERFFFHYCNHYLHAVRFSPENSKDVYKLYYHYPKWTPGHGDTCFPQFACRCDRDYKKPETPLLFNMETDPSEQHPLDIKDPRVAHVVKRIHTATLAHESGMEPVESQFSMMWWPQLQPCCNFPHCSCTDPQNPLNKGVKKD